MNRKVRTDRIRPLTARRTFAAGQEGRNVPVRAAEQEGKARGEEAVVFRLIRSPRNRALPDLPRRDNAELSPEEEQEHDAKDHQNKFQEDEKPYILLQQTKKTFHRRQGSFARNDRNAV